MQDPDLGQPELIRATYFRHPHYGVMTRYYFHVINDVETRDELGQDFANLAAPHASAERDCVAFAVESISEHRHFAMHHRIEIEDASGTIVDTTQFGDVVTVRP